jgi:hypothetical protein
MSDARGGFLGIQLAPPPALDDGERAAIAKTVAGVGAALAKAGYAGPFGVDGFVYKTGETRALHALCEINARHTFGHVARALCLKLDMSVLGFGPSPAGATMVIAQTAEDPFCAWLAV